MEGGGPVNNGPVPELGLVGCIFIQVSVHVD